MLLNNLELSFDREEEDKYIFKTEVGEEIAVDKKLIENFQDQGKKTFLAMDDVPLVFADDDKKSLLNEILGNQN